jgi:Superinfection immunity protein
LRAKEGIVALREYEVALSRDASGAESLQWRHSGFSRSRTDMISMELIALLAMIALILIALGLYWLPSIIGYCRRSPDVFTVVVTNALLGWTIVGWLVALFMATRSARPALTKPPVI